MNNVSILYSTNDSLVFDYKTYNDSHPPLPEGSRYLNYKLLPLVKIKNNQCHTFFDPTECERHGGPCGVNEQCVWVSQVNGSEEFTNVQSHECIYQTDACVKNCSDGYVYKNGYCMDVDECKGEEVYKCDCIELSHENVNRYTCDKKVYEYRLLDPSKIRCCDHSTNDGVFLVQGLRM